MKNAKPAVTLQWHRVLEDGETEHINDTQTIQHTILPENTTNQGKGHMNWGSTRPHFPKKNETFSYYILFITDSDF